MKPESKKAISKVRKELTATGFFLDDVTDDELCMAVVEASNAEEELKLNLTHEKMGFFIVSIISIIKTVDEVPKTAIN